MRSAEIPSPGAGPGTRDATVPDAACAGSGQAAPNCVVAVLAAGASADALERTLASLRSRQEGVGAVHVFDASSGVEHVDGAAKALRDTTPDATLLVAAAGVEFPPRSIDRMRAALRSDPAIHTVSPLFAGDERFAPADRFTRLRAEPALIDAWLGARPESAPAEVPFPLPACVLLSACARVVAAGADDEQWGAAIQRAGGVHAVCTATLVSAAAPPLAAGPSAARACDPSTLLAVSDDDPTARALDAVRRAIAGRFHARRPSAGSDASDDAAADDATPRSARRDAPTQLHIAHSWGGGLGRWVDDYCAADHSRRNLVLRSVGTIGAYGQRLCLQRSYSDPRPLRVWDLAVPILATAQSHLQYRRILREIVEEFDVGAVVVSCLIGHSLDALRTGLPTVIVTHDHYPHCVTLFAHFDAECASCDRTRLAQCIDANPAHQFFPGVDADDFDAMRGAFVGLVLDAGLRLVAPSESTRARWLSLMPALRAAQFDVIAHGVSLPPPLAFDPPASGKLRLVALGRLVPEKGGRLLGAILPELLEIAELTLLGCGESGAPFAGRAGVNVVAHYDHAELPALLARVAPHLGLQLSIVPETFSYTLGELWHLGVPVLACRSGSLAERIDDGVDGFLCAAEPDALLARMRAAASDRARLGAMRATLLARRSRGVADMVADHHRLTPLPPGRAASHWFGDAGHDGHGDASGRGGEARAVLGAITVSAHASYATALRAFGQYTLAKIRSSPRVPRALRRLIERLPARAWRDDHRV